MSASGDTSTTRLPSRLSDVNDVNPASGETSAISLRGHPSSFPQVFRSESDRSSSVSTVKPANGDTSTISLSLKWSLVSRVSPASADMSAISLSSKLSTVSEVMPVSGDKSSMPPLVKPSPDRLIAYSIPSSCRTPRWVRLRKFSISPRVIRSPGSLPSAASTALRRATSGISTDASESSVSLALGTGSTGSTATMGVLTKAANSARTRRLLYTKLANSIVTAYSHARGR